MKAASDTNKVFLRKSILNQQCQIKSMLVVYFESMCQKRAIWKGIGSCFGRYKELVKNNKSGGIVHIGDTWHSERYRLSI